MHKIELLMKYFVILIIAIILWLYIFAAPHSLLPSSQPPPINCPVGLDRKDFCPTWKPSLLRAFSTVHIVLLHGGEKRYQVANSSLSPRLVFLLDIISDVVYILSAALVPEFFSVYLKSDLPTHFLGLWKYPEGVSRESAQKKEY